MAAVRSTSSGHPKRASAGSLLKRLYAEEQEDQEQQKKKNCCEFDLTEFPFASGLLDGIKCCTKCGSVKTPQWREGPYGAKTLCNACGVKRTRKLRAEQEGTVKKPRKSPQKRMKQIIPAKEQRLMDLAEFRSGYAHSNRSGRAAAQESAYRTHKYAITGEWANMPPMFKTVEPSSSDNVSAPLSDSPEEIAYIGPNHGHHYQSSYPPADATARTSDDCFAAINLMTMSAKSSLDDTFFSAHGVGSGSHSAQQQQNLARTDTPESSPTKISGLTPSNLDVEAALAKISQLAGGGMVIDSNVSTLSQQIPPTKVSELIQLTHELESAQRDAQVAEASVSTVAAILAAQQASLLQRQMRVHQSSEQLQRFVYDLESKFGLTYKVLPRINDKYEQEMGIGGPGR